MENQESKWRRQELADEVKVMRSSSPEAAKAILVDQQQTPEYQEAKTLHRGEQQEMFKTREELEQKREEIEILKKKLNELGGGILTEEQACGLEVLRKKYEHLVYLVYVNEDRMEEDSSASEEQTALNIAIQSLDLPKEDVDKKQKPLIASPEKQDFSKLSVELRKENNGLYTLNPETQDIDFDALPIEKVKIVQFDELTTIHDVLSRVAKDYSGKYLLPGVELANFLLEVDADGNLINEDMLNKITSQLNEKVQFLIFPGSLVAMNSMWSELVLMRDEKNKWTHITRGELSGPYIPELHAIVLIER